MIKDLFGESALKGLRRRGSTKLGVIEVGHGMNCNYIRSKYTEADEQMYYERSEKKF